jgi:hypothetical protein
MITKSASILRAINCWSSNFFKKRWVLTGGTILAIAGIIGESHHPSVTVTIPKTPVANLHHPISTNHYASPIALPPQTDYYFEVGLIQKMRYL